MDIALFDFDEHEAIIEPKKTHPPIEGFPECVVSCFTDSIIEKFSQMEGVSYITSLQCANGKVPVYKTNFKGKDVAFYKSSVGAASCAGQFEEIIAFGAKKFVLFGSCGVLNHDIADGHMMIIERAVRDEGTSFHYAPPSLYIHASQHGVETLSKVMEELQFPYIKATTWTTDAFYRETPLKLQKRKQQECICVEMESSAMISVAKFRKVEFAQFVFAADNLDSPVWQKRGLSLHQGLNRSDQYMLTALKCVTEL